MEKSTTRTLSSRSQLTAVPPSPRLVRSRSGSSLVAITTPERSSGSRRFSTSERFTNNDGHRSKSTSKLRTEGNYINPTNKLLVTSNMPTNYCSQEKKKKRDGFGKFLQRGVISPDNSNNITIIGANSKRATLPSAWALSPGRRPLGSSPVVGFESPAAKANGSGGGSRGGGGVGSGVTKVLKYFKQMKMSSSVQGQVYHRFKILHNRLLQWRFINARAEVAMANVKNVAEIHLFSVWLRILTLRKIIIQKRIELQKVKHAIKLYHILNGQLSLLSEWANLERRNQESIGRLIRKLSALSTLLPLTHGLKADTEAVFEALNTAIKVMENFEPLITKYQTQQVERILYQVTELATTSIQEEECLQELLGIVPIIAILLENEKSIRVHLIQTKMESNTGNFPRRQHCSIMHLN